MGTAMTYVIYFMIFSALYGFWMYNMAKKKKAKAKESFNVHNEKQHAERYTREGLENQHAYVKESLNGKVIDAYVQCNEEESMGQVVKEFAKQGAKKAVFNALGGSGRSFAENPFHCFLAISGTELHFFKYQTGKDDVHQVFTKEQVSKAELKKRDKSIMQRSNYNMGDYTDYILTIKNNNGEFKFIIYQYFTEIGGNVTSGFKDSYYVDFQKFEVIALHFSDTFQKVFSKIF